MILYDLKRFKMIKIRFLSGFWFGWDEKTFLGCWLLNASQSLCMNNLFLKSFYGVLKYTTHKIFLFDHN